MRVEVLCELHRALELLPRKGAGVVDSLRRGESSWVTSGATGGVEVRK